MKIQVRGPQLVSGFGEIKIGEGGRHRPMRKSNPNEPGTEQFIVLGPDFDRKHGLGVFPTPDFVDDPRQLPIRPASSAGKEG